jgi:predicted CoA-binding protein
MAKRTVLVVGATENPSRYAYLAANKLLDKGFEVELLGLKAGAVRGVPIQTGQPELTGLDTITLYVGPGNQAGLIDYLIGLKPKRIFFNPGTENYAFQEKARQAGIDVEEGCTLVMLGSGQF